MKKVVAGVCTAAILCSIAIVGAGALTRRLYGDVNGDGIISKADVTLTQQYIAKMVTLDNYQKIAADVNGDGQINLSDVTLMNKLLTGAIDEFPVGDYFLY